MNKSIPSFTAKRSQSFVNLNTPAISQIPRKDIRFTKKFLREPEVQEFLKKHNIIPLVVLPSEQVRNFLESEISYVIKHDVTETEARLIRKEEHVQRLLQKLQDNHVVLTAMEDAVIEYQKHKEGSFTEDDKMMVKKRILELEEIQAEHDFDRDTIFSLNTELRQERIIFQNDKKRYEYIIKILTEQSL